MTPAGPLLAALDAAYEAFSRYPRPQQLEASPTRDPAKILATLSSAPLRGTGALNFSVTYDPLGRMRQNIATGASLDFFYDGDLLVAEYDGAGALIARYVHGPGVDEPLVWNAGSGTSDRRYLITDNQGSVIAENGANTVRYTYGPYGEASGGGFAGSRFRYTGQSYLLFPNVYDHKARVTLRFSPVCAAGEDDINDAIGVF